MTNIERRAGAAILALAVAFLLLLAVQLFRGLYLPWYGRGPWW